MPVRFSAENQGAKGKYGQIVIPFLILLYDNPVTIMRHTQSETRGKGKNKKVHGHIKVTV